MIGIKFDKAIRALILIMPKMSGYVKTFKVEDKIKKLISFHIENEKLLEKYIDWIKFFTSLWWDIKNQNKNI